MPTNDTNSALATELSAAIDELQNALYGASEAAARIRNLIPRVSAAHAFLDEIETLIRERRQQFGEPPMETASYSRPTLIVPEPAEAPAPPAAAIDEEPAIEKPSTPRATKPAPPELICFRLEFQSNSGPLDLRAVDDAVSEHPAVRDVALIDYDGRRATLKVWIIADASPADLQQALTERAAELFADAGEVTIIALEDAA